ncbi:hypothetical protein N182_34795 [Sinorhizobium sp. GL2]|nr:hypothetical protein N182_34795 [Sinorhizobium sp. GL2]
MTIRALVFDVDGTLAETEELHRAAFNETFVERGLGWRWDRDLYRDLLRTTGGRERILEYAGRVGAHVDAAAIHRRKTEIYNERIGTGRIALRPGVPELFALARRKGWALAIATTTTRPNVVSLLEVTLGRHAIGWFASMRTGEDVLAKKPDPEVYKLVLSDLDLPACDCIAFEDSANGLRAARAAGLRTIVTPSLYSADDDFDGADLIVPTLDVLQTSGAFGLAG